MRTKPAAIAVVIVTALVLAGCLGQATGNARCDGSNRLYQFTFTNIATTDNPNTPDFNERVRVVVDDASTNPTSSPVDAAVAGMNGLTVNPGSSLTHFETVDNTNSSLQFVVVYHPLDDPATSGNEATGTEAIEKTTASLSCP